MSLVERKDARGAWVVPLAVVGVSLTYLWASHVAHQHHRGDGGLAVSEQGSNLQRPLPSDSQSTDGGANTSAARVWTSPSSAASSSQAPQWVHLAKTKGKQISVQIKDGFREALAVSTEWMRRHRWGREAPTVRQWPLRTPERAPPPSIASSPSSSVTRSRISPLGSQSHSHTLSGSHSVVIANAKGGPFTTTTSSTPTPFAGTFEAVCGTSVRVGAAAASDTPEVLSMIRHAGDTPATDTFRIQVMRLSMAVSTTFSEETVTYRFPVTSATYVHADGSRLSVTAEECCAASGHVLPTAKAYAQQSIIHARTAAEEAKAYFRPTLQTRAGVIVTTIMEQYVNMHVGPSPVIVASFFLMYGAVAYTVQLQTLADEYEDRLADLLAVVQSARIASEKADHVGRQGAEDATGSAPPPQRAYNVYYLPFNADGSASGNAAHYAVSLPTEFIVTPSIDCKMDLRVEYRHSKDWNGMICMSSTNTSSCGGDSANHITVEAGVRRLVGDSKFSVMFYDHLESCEDTVTREQLSALLDYVWAAPTTKAVMGNGLLLHHFVSLSLLVPLPPAGTFSTNVCPHAGDSGVTFFLRSTSTKTSTHDVFELEIRVILLSNCDAVSFWKDMEMQLVKDGTATPFVNSCGPDRVCVEGLAETLPDTKIRLDAVRLARSAKWLVSRWTYDAKATMPSALKVYHTQLMDAAHYHCGE